MITDAKIPLLSESAKRFSGFHIKELRNVLQILGTWHFVHNNLIIKTLIKIYDIYNEVKKITKLRTNYLVK